MGDSELIVAILSLVAAVGTALLAAMFKFGVTLGRISSRQDVQGKDIADVKDDVETIKEGQRFLTHSLIDGTIKPAPKTPPRRRPLPG
jgi:hypothetical protein